MEGSSGSAGRCLVVGTGTGREGRLRRGITAMECISSEKVKSGERDQFEFNNCERIRMRKVQTIGICCRGA